MEEQLKLNKENRVFVGIGSNTQYPSDHKAYSPQTAYPEYIFDRTDVSAENQVYDLLRQGLYALRYDFSHYGKKEWNPLGDIIKEGDTVLIKPNWVMHYNKNKDEDNMDCLVTNPSMVRAVLDYVLIALKNTGRVIIADAPMQECNLTELFSKTGYQRLFEFYESKGIPIEVLDLRQYRVITNNNMIKETIDINEEDKSIQIDLGSKSCHFINNNLQYKVSDYLSDKTNHYHHADAHTYSIHKTVLEADIIINMPKPKCHRLAGLTAARKNIVGITYDKACLPHRVTGAKQEGGDEYKDKSIVKRLIASMEEKKLYYLKQNKIYPATSLQLIICILYAVVKLFLKDKIMLGSWYGNDTIWRTIADLNLILKYADKNGILMNLPQRRIISIADMIIAGQGNGPVKPYPKHLGILLIGEDLSMIDVICAKIMGFHPDKIPGLNDSLINNDIHYEETKKIYSNIPRYDHINLEDFVPDANWRFEPHEDWKGHIENDEI